MATSYVGGTGVGVTASATTTPALLIPAAAQAGDLAIAAAPAERELIPAINWPTGTPTVIQAVTATVGGGTFSVRMEYKVLAAGDLGQTMNATVTTARRLSLGLVVIRGASTVAFTNNAANVTPTGNNAITHPAISPGDSDSMLVSLLGAISAPGAVRTMTYTAASPYTERVEASSSSTSSNVCAYITTEQLTGGSGSTQGGAVTTGDDRSSYFATTVAVSPAATTPSIPVGWTECRLFHR